MNRLLFVSVAAITAAVFSLAPALAQESEDSTDTSSVGIADASDLGYSDSMAADACCMTAGCCCCDPYWSIRAGWVYMERSNSSSQEIFNYPNNTTVLNASDLDFGFAPGFEAAL
ncbi:MAG: hypothetical protein ACWGMZ_04600, partial [Thermoguttaceae bacterium]